MSTWRRLFSLNYHSLEETFRLAFRYYMYMKTTPLVSFHNTRIGRPTPCKIVYSPDSRCIFLAMLIFHTDEIIWNTPHKNHINLYHRYIFTLIWADVCLHSHAFSSRFHCETADMWSNTINYSCICGDGVQFNVCSTMTFNFNRSTRLFIIAHIYGVYTAYRNPNTQTPTSIKTQTHAYTHTHAFKYI